MKRIINWLRYCWAKLSTNDSRNTLGEDRPDDRTEGAIERTLSKVYYSTPGSVTRWAYIDKGRIIKNTKRPY